MEGTLSKWTNVVHGWQHRYFVLNDDMLCYYTSKEKMARGQQRGCIRLRGAALGIDEENNSQFTIAVDGKVFHLQGRSQMERDTWVRVLERVIHEKCGYYKPPQEDPLQDLRKRVVTAENQSQMLLEQTRNLEQINKESEKAEHKRKKMLSEILLTAKRFQTTVDHSLVLLQQVQRDFSMDNQKQTLKGNDKAKVAEKMNGGEGSETKAEEGRTEGNGSNGKEEEEEAKAEELNLADETEQDVDQIVSYSSSDNEEFYDATEGKASTENDSMDGDRVNYRRASKDSLSPRKHSHHSHHHVYKRSSILSKDEVDWGKFDEKHTDYDAIYDNTHEQDVGDINKQHGSVLMHLLSQVSVGMDLTKVTLPTFILERRSLLEMYADFFAHPDDFISAVNLDSAQARFLGVVKYYLNSFYPARKTGVAKKPYNPILGESFRCRWTLPGTIPSTTSKTQSGPFPGSATNQVTFIAEQISHHPPISAFYAEHPDAGVSCVAHIYTKSSFLGLSIGVQMIGSGTVKLHKHDETYVVSFPNGYGRSIMSTPWIELGGKVEIRCDKTQYRAEIEFLTKPFFRGKPHQIVGHIFHGNAAQKKPIMQLKGEWNGNIYLRQGDTGEYHLFSNVRQKPDVRKECVLVMDQEDRESRKLWRHVTAALFHENIEVASQAKRWIEQRQRNEKEKRDKAKEHWQARFFERINPNPNSTSAAPTDGWRYREPLEERLKTIKV